MRKVFAIVVEFFLFLLLDVVGGVFYHPFHIETALPSGVLGSRSFVWDGVLFMLIAWVILLLFSVVRKKLPVFAPQITVALALAGLVGYFLKVGFITHNW